MLNNFKSSQTKTQPLTLSQGLSLVIALLLFGSFACKKEEPDNQQPVVIIHYPGNEISYHHGDTIKYSALLMDNIALKNGRVEIHPGNDHVHKDIRQEWFFNKEESASGEETSITGYIIIPATADTGRYHFMIYATDEAGNEDFSYRGFKITLSP